MYKCSVYEVFGVAVAEGTLSNTYYYIIISVIRGGREHHLHQGV